MPVNLRLRSGAGQMRIGLLRFLKRRTRGFTLVELLAVMAIIGILSGIVAGAVTGLGTSGINAQIVSDTKVIETAADRFLNASFPETYPIESLPEGEEDLGVRAINFDARLPQDPSKNFTPDFLKDIPDSAALVNYRIELTTGRIFPADDAAAFAPPARSRLDISLSDRTPSGNPDVSFRLKMSANRAALETLQTQIPAGVIFGGQSLAADAVLGSLEITFGVDNPWRSGHEISVDADVVATGSAHEWEIVPDYTSATSDAELDSRGGLLLETVVAIIVFALIGTTVLVGVSTARRSGEIVDAQSIAENVARNQMEYVFSRAYKAPPLSYASISDLPGNDFNVPSDFTVTATAILRTGSTDPDLETVRVTVNHLGEQVLVVETIRGLD